MLSPDSITDLEKALNAPGSDLRKTLANFLQKEFPEFEVLLDVPAHKLGIQEDFKFDIIAKVKQSSEEDKAGDIVLSLATSENLNLNELKLNYDRLSKLKSDSVLTVVLAKESTEKLESIGAALIEKNNELPSGKWLDNVVVLSRGIVGYGAHDPTTQVVGNFLYHNAISEYAALPALYFKLMATPTNASLQALMYKIAATLLLTRPSKRHREVNSLFDASLQALPLITYQYDLQGQLRMMPEDQYLGRKLPTFPIEIVLPDDEVVGQLDYLEWQDGGVMILEGNFPLEIFVAFGDFHGRPTGKTQKGDVQISSILPLTKRGFNYLVQDMQAKSNFRFRSSRPPLIIQKLSNEGVGVPLIARVHMGLLTLRDCIPKSSLNIDGYDGALQLVYSNLMSARESIKKIDDIYSTHLAGLADGTVGRLNRGTIQISHPFDQPLRAETERFINSCSRVIRVGMRDLFVSLGVNLEFFFKKESSFRDGIDILAVRDPALADYLSKCRNEWSDTLIKLRNEALEHGAGLITAASYKVDQGRITMSEPKMAERPLRQVSTFIFDKICKFVEEVTIYLLQKKLTSGFAFTEISFDCRDPTCATRFRLALTADGGGWQIKYTDTPFDQT